MARYRVKVSGSIGDKPHKPGDILDVPAYQGDQWVKAGIADKVAQPRRLEEPEEGEA